MLPILLDANRGLSHLKHVLDAPLAREVPHHGFERIGHRFVQFREVCRQIAMISVSPEPHIQWAFRQKRNMKSRRGGPRPATTAATTSASPGAPEAAGTP